MSSALDTTNNRLKQFFGSDIGGGKLAHVDHQILVPQTVIGKDTNNAGMWAVRAVGIDEKNHTLKMFVHVDDGDPQKVQEAIAKKLMTVPAVAAGLDTSKTESYTDVVRKFRAVEDKSKGLIADELAMAQQWVGNKKDDEYSFYRRGREGLDIENSDREPLTLRYHYDSMEQLHAAKAALEARLPAYSEAILRQAQAAKKEDGTPALSPEALAVLQQQLAMRLHFREHMSDGNTRGHISVRIGVPDPKGELTKDGQVKLVNSDLNTLPGLDKILHDVFAYADTEKGNKPAPGNEWYKSFHLLATPNDMRDYLKFRMKEISDPNVVGQIQALLKSEELTSCEERKKNNEKIGELLTVHCPTENKPKEHNEYVATIRMPEGRSAYELLQKIVAAAPAGALDVRGMSLARAGEAVSTALQGKVADGNGNAIPVSGVNVLVGMDGGQESVTLQIPMPRESTVYQRQMGAAALNALSGVAVVAQNFDLTPEDGAPAASGKMRPRVTSWREEDGISMTLPLPAGVTPTAVVEGLAGLHKQIFTPSGGAMDSISQKIHTQRTEGICAPTAGGRVA